MEEICKRACSARPEVSCSPELGRSQRTWGSKHSVIQSSKDSPGGALSAAGGGKFQEGFLGAFAGGYLGDKLGTYGGATGTGGASDLIKRAIRDAVIGGTASQLGGGKFKNGAVTAAFARLFNDEVHKERNHDQRGRQLTEKEVEAARSEFPDLDTSVVRVKYDLAGDGAYTPRNTIHFPKAVSSCQDFIACSGGDYAGWFIHEITHVWQYQNGVSPFWGHIFSKDVLRFGDYLPLSTYRITPSPLGLSTEKQGDWHM